MKRESVNCALCHDDAQADRRLRAERGALAVSIITLITMAVEIVAGLGTGSMALLADGIHMGTHALALFITLLAYVFARKLRNNPAFSFGTGKVGVLGGYTNALLLGASAVFMVAESVDRLLNPAPIRYGIAMLVAAIGLAVNLVCALILDGAGHSHDGEHGHEHVHQHDHAAGGHRDSNLSGALLHVLADAATSVLAILALAVGKLFGWTFLDPAVGLLGAALILRWAFGLVRDSGAVLLDFGEYGEELSRLRERLERGGDRVLDLHLWRYSENARSLILTVEAPADRSADDIRASIADLVDAGHVTIEVRHP